MTETVEIGTKGRVDPEELLQKLSKLLGMEGNINGPDGIDQLVKLMSEQIEAGKMVSKCTYLNTLQATTDITLLQRFVDVGGWSTLNDYLQQAREQDNTPLLMDILTVYGRMPVTVDLLKQNTSAKTIKQLGKSSSDPELKEKASQLVASWMQAIRGDSAPSSSDKKKSKKSSSSSSKDNSTHSSSSKSSPHHHLQFDTANHHTYAAPPINGSPTEPTPPSKDISRDSITHSVETSSKKPRPKTVKSVPTKFRSTGLLDADSPTKDKPTTKRPSQSKTNPTAKRPKPAVEVNTSLPTTSKTTSPTEEKQHGKIKLIPARPKPVPPKEVYESSGFMDALAPSTLPPLKIRKRKLSYGKEVEKKPTTQSNPGNQTTNSKPAEEATEKTNSPNSPVEKKPVLPSFYKDTLETSDNEDDKKPSENTDSESVATTEQSAVDDDAKSETSHSSYEPPKKKRKKVSWAEESKLKDYYYFELDETERVNVNRLGTDFADIKRKEMMREKEMFEESRRQHHQNPRHSGDIMSESIMWRTPPRLTLQGETIERGCNSKEKEVQRQREDGVLLALYFNKHMIPESPAEPDPEEVLLSDEPRVMPLDDETGQSGEVVYTDYPKPVTSPPRLSLPPDLADLLATMAQQAGQTAQPNQFHDQSGHNPQPFGNPPFSQSRNAPPLDQQQLQQLINSLMQGQTSLDSLPDDVKAQIQEMLTLQAQGAIPPPNIPNNQPVHFDRNIPPPGIPPHGPPPRAPPGGLIPPPFMGPPGMMRGRPPMAGGPPGPMRPRMGVRGDMPLCRHFMAGSCRYGPTCRRLHPGVNGPPINGMHPPNNAPPPHMSPPLHASPQHV